MTKRQKTILIVEDNDLNMKLFQHLVEASGYLSIGTANGFEGIELARKNKPDLILMDIQLPEVSGLDVIQLLKADPELQGIPIIAVTAFAMKGDAERIMQAGCQAYMSKPIAVSDFISAIKTHLGEGE